MIRRSSVDSTPTTLLVSFSLMVERYGVSTVPSSRTRYKRYVISPLSPVLARFITERLKCTLTSREERLDPETCTLRSQPSRPQLIIKLSTRNRSYESSVKLETLTGQTQLRSARSSHKSTATPHSTVTETSSFWGLDQFLKDSGTMKCPSKMRWPSGASVLPLDPMHSTPRTPRATEREPGGTCGSNVITRKLGSLPLCVESLLVAQEVAALTQRRLRLVGQSLTPWLSCSVTRASMGGTFKSYRLTFASRALRGPVEVIVSWPVSLSCPTSENPRPERSSRHAKKEGLRPGPI